jgi:hypothetical protein
LAIWDLPFGCIVVSKSASTIWVHCCFKHSITTLVYHPIICKVPIFQFRVYKLEYYICLVSNNPYMCHIWTSIVCIVLWQTLLYSFHISFVPNKLYITWVFIL